MHGRVRTERLEEAGDDVDLDTPLVEVTDDLERLSVRSLGEGDDDAVDIENGNDLRQLRRSSEDTEVLEPVDSLPRVLVHEADDVHPVLRMLKELLGDTLSDVPRADDERVQDVGVASPAQRTRDRAADRDESDREHPEERELRKARVCEIEDVREREEEPRADGEHVEDAEELVDARVIGSLLIARVEVVDATQNDPEWQGQSKEDDLRVGADAVVLGVDVRREENLGQREGKQDAGRVRNGERTAHEPSSATDAAASLLDQLARAVVDEVEQPYPRDLVRGREWSERL